jgi:hypothetical protein
LRTQPNKILDDMDLVFSGPFGEDL